MTRYKDGQRRKEIVRHVGVRRTEGTVLAKSPWVMVAAGGEKTKVNQVAKPVMNEAKGEVGGGEQPSRGKGAWPTGKSHQPHPLV